jgi:hypothetical protein
MYRHVPSTGLESSTRRGLAMEFLIETTESVFVAIRSKDHTYVYTQQQGQNVLVFKTENPLFVLMSSSLVMTIQ